MRLLNYVLDFEHYHDVRSTRAFLYSDPMGDPIAWAESTAHVKDIFSRRGGRRACMSKILDPRDGAFAGTENKRFRRAMWQAYWKLMPQDLDPHFG